MTWQQLLVPVAAALVGYLLRHWQGQRSITVAPPPLLPGLAARHPLAAEVAAVVRHELDVFLLQLIRSGGANTAPAAAGRTDQGGTEGGA